MTLNDYLQAKYGVDKPTTMLGCEARAFGVPYPLRNGWLQQHGHVVITRDTAAKLRMLLERNGNESALRGLKVLDKAWLELKTQPHANSKDFLQSKAWKRLRLRALQIHGGKCQCCGASPATGAVLHVDHIKPRLLFPDLALRLDNLQVLCGDCNEGKGNWDMTDWRQIKKVPVT